MLASRVEGNIGMLGKDYDGYFPVGNETALARLVLRCQAHPEFLNHLAAQCSGRATLFSPMRERRTLLALLQELLN